MFVEFNKFEINVSFDRWFMFLIYYWFILGEKEFLEYKLDKM